MMLDMEIISNQQFLDMLNNKSLYKENISNSLEKISEIVSLIFRKANHWYRFEDCDLPNSTIIREWPSISLHPETTVDCYCNIILLVPYSRLLSETTIDYCGSTIWSKQ